MRALIIDTWSNGTNQPVIVDTVQLDHTGLAVMKWFHDHTPFSEHEALTNQGFKVLKVLGWSKAYNERNPTEHLVVPYGDDRSRAACGTTAMLRGQTEKEPTHPCQRCMKYVLAK